MPRLNYTGRKRILREHAIIEMREIGKESYRPELELDLEDYDFPSSAEIWLELSNRENLWRRRFGTVGSPGFTGPSVISPLSADVPLHARLKIINREAGTAKILGLMKKVRIFGTASSAQGAGSRSFVEVLSEDLGPQVWTLDIPRDEEEAPILLVNKRIENARAMVKDPLFRSVVMPTVLERVLERIILAYEFHDFTSDSAWGKILTFADRIVPADAVKGLPEVTRDESSVDVINDWIQEVVRVWSAEHNFAKVFNEAWSRGGDA